MTLAEKAEQLRDTAMALRPKLVPDYQAIVEAAVPTSTDPAQLECIDLPEITENMGPAEVIHLVKESATPACFQRITPESVLVEIETDPLTFATRFVRLAESLSETQRCVRDLLNHVDKISNHVQGMPQREELRDLRQWVSNLSARVPV